MILIIKNHWEYYIDISDFYLYINMKKYYFKDFLKIDKKICDIYN